MPPIVDDPDRFTPSALRALERAVHIAGERLHREVGPAHLLRALLDEESRASEVLAEFGLETDRVDGLLDEQTPDVDDRSNVVRRTRSRDAQMSVLQGIRFSGIRRDGQLVGSEHLLFGLTAVDSDAAQLLAAAGLDEEKAGQLARGGEESPGEPLPVDFSLGLDEHVVAVHKEVERAIPTVPTTPSSGHDLGVLRVLDAAANRAREGLRVAEDHVRFLLDDAHLVRLLKGVRHDLAAGMQRFDERQLVRARETTGDVGTTVATESESRRASADDVLRAALKRAEEAVRSLEEFGKVLDPEAAGRFESLRYRLYAIEKAVLGTLASRATFDGRHLYFLLTRGACVGDPEVVLREALAGGVSIVQVREKSMPDRELVDWGSRVREITREAGALMIVNDRPDLAVVCDADGVHVGQDELSVRHARRIVGPDRLVGVSTHDLDQARAAVRHGADCIGVGPTFPSRTKRFDDFPGLDLVRAVSAEISLPTFVLGGVNVSNVADVVAAGGTRIAVTAAIGAAADPRAAAAELAKALSPMDP